MANVQGTTFLLSAADVTWVRNQRLCVEVTAAGAASDGTYFTIDAPAADGGASNLYYVWYNQTDGASVDPAPAGRTAIQVDILSTDTAVQKATKLKDAMEAEADFRAKLDSTNAAIVLIDTEFGGKVDNAPADVDTTDDLVVIKAGLGGSLGKTSGGIEVTMESNSVQINSDQTGALVLDDIITGQTVEATMSFLEMTPERWETIVGSVTGDTYTPVGGSQVVGFGESRLYQSLFDLGGRLVLHPTRFAASNKSYDITFPLSAPKPSSINFSGEEPQVMEVTFSALLDSDTNEAVNLMVFGDSSQDLR
jgi:hypothetical protein